jgi:acyl carrier protein
MTTESRAVIVEQLKAILSRVSNGRANVDRLPDEARLIEDIGLASLDLLELRFELESTWNARITDEEAVSLKCIRDVVDAILSKGELRAS